MNRFKGKEILGFLCVIVLAVIVFQMFTHTDPAADQLRQMTDQSKQKLEEYERLNKKYQDSQMQR